VPGGSVLPCNHPYRRPELAAQPQVTARAQLMSGAIRFPLTLGLLMLASCGRPRGPSAEPTRCGPSVPQTAQHPIATPPSSLAGDYELIQVSTQPAGGTVARGRLHLAPLDSATRARAAGGAVRDLIGWIELAIGDSAWRAAVASRDPNRPGVVVAGQRLRIGHAGYPGGLTHNLEITAVGAEGFWGWWRSDLGLAVTESGSRRVLPDPAGYFCALRFER